MEVDATVQAHIRAKRRSPSTDYTWCTHCDRLIRLNKDGSLRIHTKYAKRRSYWCDAVPYSN